MSGEVGAPHECALTSTIEARLSGHFRGGRWVPEMVGPLPGLPWSSFGPAIPYVAEGVSVEIRSIDGREYTNRAGVAELAGVSHQAVTYWSHESRRADVGFPSSRPDPNPTFPQLHSKWYAVDEARTFAELLKARGRRPKALPVPAEPDRLITAHEFAQLIGVTDSAFRYYVNKSVDDWDRNDPGAYLIKPAVDEPGQGGRRRLWRVGDVVRWQNSRQGSGRTPADRG